MFSRRLLIALLLLTSAAIAQETQRQYLSGKGTDDAVPWEFFCSDGNNSAKWTTLAVPSCWDVQGFGALGYGKISAGENFPHEQGKYRHRFNVPAKWKDQSVFLVFDGSMTDTQAWVNGHSAGPMHQGAFYRFKYDVTDLVKFGAENLLEVTVDKESANTSVNNAERRGDYWNFGGIFRPVYLEAVPTQHIERVAINARADGTFAMNVFAAEGDSVRAQIMDLAGKPMGQPISMRVTEGKAKIETKIDSPRQWTAETPELYQAEMTLMRGETVLHRIRQKFGFRTIEVRPGEGLFVNGQRVLLKGTDRHTFWPESGRASNEKLSRDDIALMKEMNNNAVRMSHYPPDEHFLEACDEMGLYVLDELAGWHQAYDTPTGKRLIEQMVTRDVNHPCILFWDNGNEGGWNSANDDEFARWDPQQRNVLHPWAPFRGINTKHYPTYDRLLELVRGPDVYFPTEFQHALFDGGGGTALADYWGVIRSGKAAAGGFIWAFCDEALERKDQNGKMDTRGNLAPDGVLGPYRQKEASFYAIKQIWSPIVVVRDEVSGEFTIENRYDFTNTDRCAFTWELRQFPSPDQKAGFTIVAHGNAAAPSIEPHKKGRLALDLPASDADALALTAHDPAGRELWTWVWPVKRTAKLVTKPKSAEVHANEDGNAIAITTGDLALRFDKQTGYLTNAKRGEKNYSLLNGPRPSIGSATLTKIEHHTDDGDYVIRATYAGTMKSVEWRIKPTGWIELQYTYSLDATCDYFGVSFDLPEKNVKSMKWLGIGPYRVWKNRLEGGTLGVWENAYNNTMTGYTDWIYPEFKGYYAGVRWMKLQTTSGPITVALDDPPLYIQVLRPEFPNHPKPFSPTTAATQAVKQHARLSANAWANFPDAGFSILHGIAPMGTKFQIPAELGPQSQQNRAHGKYHAAVRIYFGEK